MTFQTVVVESVKLAGLVDIDISLPFEVICTVPRKPYGGTVNITYSPRRYEEGHAVLLEWNSFAEYVRSLRSEEYLAEEFASMLLVEIVRAVRPVRITIELVVESAFHLPVRIVATMNDE